MNKFALTALAILMASPSYSADMGRRRSASVDETAVRIVAAEYATAKFAARVCRQSDGVAFNGIYFQQKIASVGGRSKAADRITKNEVAATNSRLASELAVKGVSDWCDDYLDTIADNWGPSYGAGPTSNPVYWSDPSGLFGGPGIGPDDPFADFDDGL